MVRKKTSSIYLDLTPGELAVLDFNKRNMGARQRKPAVVQALFNHCRSMGGDPVAIAKEADDKVTAE